MDGHGCRDITIVTVRELSHNRLLFLKSLETLKCVFLLRLRPLRELARQPRRQPSGYTPKGANHRRASASAFLTVYVVILAVLAIASLVMPTAVRRQPSLLDGSFNRVAQPYLRILT